MKEMKKSFLLIIGLLFTGLAFAQNAEVVNAYNYLKFNELDKAKTAIDKAVKDPKTGINAKTWFYRGQIYMGIASSQDPVVKAYDTDALNKAIESFEKTQELDAKKNYVNDIKRNMIILMNMVAQKGIDEYQNKNYAEAAHNFERTSTLRQQLLSIPDTAMLFNAALAYQNADNIVKTKELLSRLIELNYPEPQLYTTLAGIQLTEKDTTAALATLDIGKLAYPTNNSILIEELNIYIARKQEKLIIDKMEAAAATDPTNKTLFFALGSTYDNMGKKENAEKAYLKAIELDSNYFDAYYNLGAMHYNSGVEIFNKVKDLPLNKQKEYDTGKAQYMAAFKKAQPHLEKANKLQPEDMNTLVSLAEVYAKTQNLAKAKEIQTRISQLKKTK